MFSLWAMNVLRGFSPVTTPRPVFRSSLLSAFSRIGRPFTVTEQNGELRNSLHVSPTTTIVDVDSRFAMEHVFRVVQREGVRVIG